MVRGRMLVLVSVFGVALAGCSSAEPAAPAPVVPSSAVPVDDYPQLKMTSAERAAMLETFRFRFPALSVGRSDDDVLQSFVNVCLNLEPGESPGSTVFAMFLSAQADKTGPTTEIAELGSFAVTRVCRHFVE